MNKNHQTNEINRTQLMSQEQRLGLPMVTVNGMQINTRHITPPKALKYDMKIFNESKTLKCLFFPMQMIQEMGNSRARAVYEANVPDTFRRPQTDSYPFLFT